MRERMLRGELYIADDPDSQAEFDHVQELLAEFNGAPARAWAERDRLLRQVLRHVGDGHDNLKIGALLGITERTVKAHITSIYRKVGAQSRVELALAARGLLATAPA